MSDRIQIYVNGILDILNQLHKSQYIPSVKTSAAIAMELLKEQGINNIEIFWEDESKQFKCKELC
jgi:hypothetical protein